MSNYLNKYGLINAGSCSTLDNAEENCLLYSAQYLIMLKKLGLPYQNFLDRYINYVELCREGNGFFRQRPDKFNGDEDWMSHDSLTGLICVSKEFSLNYHVEIWEAIKRQTGRYDNVNQLSPKWDRFLHPRDIIFYGYIVNNPICISLIWVLWIIQLVSCIQKWKYRGGDDNSSTCTHLFEYLSKTCNYCKYCGLRQIHKTDGKILTWLRCKTLNWKLTLDFYQVFNKYSSGFNRWVDVFSTYYNIDHIIVKLLVLLKY